MLFRNYFVFLLILVLDLLDYGFVDVVCFVYLIVVIYRWVSLKEYFF